MGEARKVHLEVALNGGQGRRWQAGMPITADEIAADAMACLEAGASVIHFHVYDPETGAHQERRADLHRAVYERLRPRTGAICYSTTCTRLGEVPAVTLDERFRVERELSADDLLDAFVLDPGSCTFANLAALERGKVYVNTPQETQAGFHLAKATGLAPALAHYELGFARTAMAAAAAAGLPWNAAMHRVMFSDHFAWGLPPDAGTLGLVDAAMKRLGIGRWMVAGIDFDVFAVMDAALELGCDLRVGFEDAPGGVEMSNAQMVAAAVKRIEAAGLGVSTPAEARAALLGPVRAAAHRG